MCSLQMLNSLVLRDAAHEDVAALESLYATAFPDEDLLPLVRNLLQDPDVTTSLVATINSAIAGHAVFTTCGVEGSHGRVTLLGPVAAEPNFQRQGIGSNLIGQGLKRMRDAGVNVVCVLGDPAYYGRLGFGPESHIEPPYPLPPEWGGAWQSQYLDRTTAPLTGRLTIPHQWRDPALWSPDPEPL